MKGNSLASQQYIVKPASRKQKSNEPHSAETIFGLTLFVTSLVAVYGVVAFLISLVSGN